MKRLGLLVLVLFLMVAPATASADWRWAPPPKHKLTYKCVSKHCQYQAQRRAHHRLFIWNKHRHHEWNLWTHRYVPACTWYGESGYGPQYSRIRYTMPNSQGSGALGKFQFMSGTYHSVAKYHDWSPLDQEISARRLFWLQGTGPWSNCH